MGGRVRIADQFDEIHNRMEELRIQNNPSMKIDLTNPGRLSLEECFAVAKMMNCTWAQAYKLGCGNPNSKKCVILGKCGAG